MVISKMENLMEKEYYIKNGKKNLYKLMKILIKKMPCLRNEVEMMTKKYNVCVKYEGDFIKGKYNGKGNQFYSDLEFYIGQFKNNKKEGKGVIYYNYSNIRYEGDFKEDHITRKGKYYHENGYYTIGIFLKGKRNGKGKMYDINDKIYYDGNFVNAKNNEYGKLYNDGVLIYEGNF